MIWTIGEGTLNVHGNLPILRTAQVILGIVLLGCGIIVN